MHYLALFTIPLIPLAFAYMPMFAARRSASATMSGSMSCRGDSTHHGNNPHQQSQFCKYMVVVTVVGVVETLAMAAYQSAELRWFSSVPTGVSSTIHCHQKDTNGWLTRTTIGQDSPINSAKIWVICWNERHEENPAVCCPCVCD